MFWSGPFMEKIYHLLMVARSMVTGISNLSILQGGDMSLCKCVTYEIVKEHVFAQVYNMT